MFMIGDRVRLLHSVEAFVRDDPNRPTRIPAGAICRVAGFLGREVILEWQSVRDTEKRVFTGFQTPGMFEVFDAFNEGVL